MLNKIMPGSVTFTTGMFWGMVAFVLAVCLLAVLWGIWVVRSQHLAPRQFQMNETEQGYEGSPLSRDGEQLQVHAPEQEKLLLRR